MHIKRILLSMLTPILFGRTVSVRELPPEPIPRGTCTQGHSGYLGVEEPTGNRFALSDKELGEYIRSQIKKGYSVSLYPQESGRIFAIAKCESNGSTDLP